MQWTTSQTALHWCTENIYDLHNAVFFKEKNMWSGNTIFSDYSIDDNTHKEGKVRALKPILVKAVDG